MRGVKLFKLAQGMGINPGEEYNVMDTYVRIF